jgi:hypothetical protein
VALFVKIIILATEILLKVLTDNVSLFETFPEKVYKQPIPP